MSHLESEYLVQVRAARIPEPVRELRLHPSRRFRFDFAWIEHKLAVEIEGGAPEAGHHHSSRKGYLSDCRKYNLAVVLGWRLLRFTGKQVRSGEAIAWTKFALEGKQLPWPKYPVEPARAEKAKSKRSARDRSASNERSSSLKTTASASCAEPPSGRATPRPSLGTLSWRRWPLPSRRATSPWPKLRGAPPAATRTSRSCRSIFRPCRSRTPTTRSLLTRLSMSPKAPRTRTASHGASPGTSDETR